MDLKLMELWKNPPKFIDMEAQEDDDFIYDYNDME